MMFKSLTQPVNGINKNIIVKNDCGVHYIKGWHSSLAIQV